MGKPKMPKGPDYNRLLDITERNLRTSEGLTREFLQFQKQAYRTSDARAEDFYKAQLAEMQRQGRLSETQLQRYMEQGIPVEDELARQLTEWGSPERAAQQEAYAMADMANAVSAERANLEQRLVGLGVDPSQVIGQGLRARLGVAGAAAQAAAGTRARQQANIEGLGFLGDAANLYRGLPQVSAQAAQVGGAAGTQGLNMANWAKAFGQQGFGQGQNMVGQQQNIATSGWNTANNIYGNQLNAWQLRAMNSPLNTIAGLAGTWVGAGMPALPFEQGGYVPPAASPSGGAIPDDVPAFLSAGEVVLPESVVRYHGLKTINKLVESAKVGDKRKGVSA
jgi:hypothetical protein